MGVIGDLFLSCKTPMINIASVANGRSQLQVLHREIVSGSFHQGRNEDAANASDPRK
jgi:hypothetical protein